MVIAEVYGKAWRAASWAWQAIVIWCRLLLHVDRRAASRLRSTAGSARAAARLRTARTTKTSMSVVPDDREYRARAIRRPDMMWYRSLIGARYDRLHFTQWISGRVSKRDRQFHSKWLLGV